MTTDDAGAGSRAHPLWDLNIAIGAIGLVALFGLLVIAGRADYLAYHSVIEFLVASVALAFFAISWHTRKLVDDDYLTVLGIFLLFEAGSLVLHALTYDGIAVFPTANVTMGSQFWILARVILAAGLIVSPMFIERRLRRPVVAIAVIGTPVGAAVWMVFAHSFPITFVAGQGLTPFKIYSEWAIIAGMAAGWWLLSRKRHRLEPSVFTDLSLAIGCMIAAELTFTAYTSLTDIFNVVGHVFHLASFYFVYRALVARSLEDPFAVLFRRLSQREQELREDNLFSTGLNQIVTDINTWMNIDDILGNAMAGATAVAGADGAIVSLHDGAGRFNVRYAHGPHLQSTRGMVLDRSLAPHVYEAAESGEPVVIADTLTDRRAGAVPERYGTRSLLSIPLMMRGEATGIMSLHWSAPCETVTSPRLILFARKLGAALSLALANALLYEGEHRVAETLQGAMAASVETSADVEIGSVYRSAPGIGSVGGDFYDVFDLPDGNVAFVLGDVSGKGIEAAATNARTRSTMRALAYRNPDPARVLSGTNEALLRQLGDSEFVTAVFGVLDPRSFAVAIGVAGHPEPIVCGRPDLSPGDSRNPPLAVVAGQTFDVWRFAMRPDETLVLFSDGICEARRNGELFGMDRARWLLDSCSGQSSQKVADALLREVEQFSDGVLRDDVAVLTMKPQRRGESRPSPL